MIVLFCMYTNDIIGLDDESHRVIAELRGETYTGDHSTGGDDVEMGVVADDGNPDFEDMPTQSADSEAFVCALRDVRCVQCTIVIITADTG